MKRKYQPGSSGCEEPTNVRRICILVVHGIGQQRRGECARALAATMHRVCARQCSTFAITPLATEGSESGPAASFAVGFSSHENLQIDFHELYWGPLACSRVRASQMARWLMAVGLKLCCLLVAGRLCRKTVWDVCQFLVAAGAAFMAALVMLHTAAGLVSGAALCLFLLLCTYWNFAENYLADVMRYFCVNEYDKSYRVRRRIQRAGGAKLLQVLGDQRYDSVIPVAHSLGTVILADVLKSARARAMQHSSHRVIWTKLAGLVTMGTPLQKCCLLRLGDARPLTSVGESIAVRAWINLFYQNDPVADVIQFASSDGYGIRNVRLRAGFPLLCHTHYWSEERVGELLLEMCWDRSASGLECANSLTQAVGNSANHGSDYEHGKPT